VYCASLGTQFLYTSHGWTLVSAVVEKTAGVPFESYLKSMLDDLGLENTYMETNAPIIPHRGRLAINCILIIGWIAKETPAYVQ